MCLIGNDPGKGRLAGVFFSGVMFIRPNTPDMFRLESSDWLGDRGPLAATRHYFSRPLALPALRSRPMCLGKQAWEKRACLMQVKKCNPRYSASRTRGGLEESERGQPVDAHSEGVVPAALALSGIPDQGIVIL